MPPNTALQTDKASCHAFCIRKSHASPPLPLSLDVRRRGNVASKIWKSAWFILVLLAADLSAERPDDLELATAHYAAFLFASVASQPDEELSEKGMSDAEEHVLLEKVSSRVARCYLESLSVYGDATFDAAIQLLAAGGDPTGLRPLLREAVKAAGDWNAIIGAMSHEQEICIAAMNQEFGINYY